MKTFDEAGRELAERCAEERRGYDFMVDCVPLATEHIACFLAGRDSCKEALRVACEVLDAIAEAPNELGLSADDEREEVQWCWRMANRASHAIRASGCYVGEE